MLYLGLMSGTSLDGVDGVVAGFGSTTPQVLGHLHQPFEPALRRELLALNTTAPDEIHRSALAANGVARACAGVVDGLLRSCGLAPADIRAIGAHGQTVRHRPLAHDGTGYTVQLLNGALLAELTRVDVVCDFRSRDVAAGGQGAPLVPAFHEAVFGEAGAHTAVLNIGGIANLTLLAPDAPVLGFDTGPGNLLMDLWAERHLGTRFDDDGACDDDGASDDDDKDGKNQVRDCGKCDQECAADC